MERPVLSAETSRKYEVSKTKKRVMKHVVRNRDKPAEYKGGNSGRRGMLRSEIQIKLA